MNNEEYLEILNNPDSWYHHLIFVKFLLTFLNTRLLKCICLMKKMYFCKKYVIRFKDRNL